MKKKNQKMDSQILMMYVFIALFAVFVIMNIFFVSSNLVPALLTICVSLPIASMLALEGIEMHRRVINRQQEIDTLRMIIDSQKSKA